MKLNIYSVYDSAAGAFMSPFFMQNDGMAFRTFSDHVNADEANNVSKHPEHFSLWFLGTFNDESGYIEACEPAKRLVTANELIQRDIQTVPTQDLAEMHSMLTKMVRELGLDELSQQTKEAQ